MKFIHNREDYALQVAFFKNAEELRFGSDSESSDNRYSYDIAGRNKEANQLNGKIEYRFGGKEEHRVGLSGMYGGLYNLDTQEMGSHSALAVHYELNYQRTNLKAQILTYRKEPENALAGPRNVVTVTAYGAPYNIAAHADIYTLGIAHDIPVQWGSISNLLLYNDFAYMDKRVDELEDTFMNVTGVLVTAGQVYTYVDFATGKHHPWIGPQWEGALAEGDPANGWEMRFNINMGYYC